MSQEFKFTDPGEGLQEAEILEVHVSEGDNVEDGDTVLTVETDKANTDVPAPFSGTIKEVRVAEGDTVEVGDVLMTYDEGGESEDGDESSQDKKKSESKKTGGKKADKKEAAESEEEEDRQAEEREDEAGSEEEDSGEGETDEDEKDEEEKKKKGKKGKKEEEPKKEEPEESERSERRDEDQDEDGGKRAEKHASHREPVPAAPSTRRLAREKGVDLHDIEPSGNEGRVTAEDVEAAAQAAEGQKEDKKSKGGKRRPGGSPLVPGGEPPALPDFSQWGEVERAPLRSIRRATARNMARSWGQIPHVYHQDIADVTELERFRRENEDSAETHGGKFTLTVLVMKALASALKRFPRFNASLDVENQEIVLKHYCHIGLAVATDRGLLVPVIRDVDQKSLVELTEEATEIAQKTRGGDIKREDMQGGSITVTNPGPMGGSSLTPLINHPQVAILGMGQARLEPVVHGDLDSFEIKPRLRLPLILGFDHRVNDGADAAQFVTTLIRTLADPESLLLNI